MQINKNINIKSILIEIVLVIYLISVLYSKTLLTITMGLIFLMAFVDIEYKNGIRISLRKDLKSTFTRFTQSKEYIVIPLIFILVVLSGFNSFDLIEWKHHIVLKLPFLILPFAFYSFDHIPLKQYFRLYIYFVILMFVSTIPVLFNYFSNKEQVDNLIKTGQIIDTPIDHIKYSILLAFSVAAGYILYINNHFFKYKKVIKLIALMGIFNFVVLHILAVRSGIIIVYILLLYLIPKCNRFKMNAVVLLIAFLFIFPVFSYYFIDSFKNKIDYAKYDYKMLIKGKGEDYSDSERFYSWKTGYDIFKKHKLFGVGIGDLKTESIKSYKILFPDKTLKFKYPHNQILFILSSSGILGLLLFLAGIYFPIFYKRAVKDPFFTSFMILITISFVVENTIERSYSIGIYLFFVLIALNHSLSYNQKPKDNNYLCANFKNHSEQY